MRASSLDPSFMPQSDARLVRDSSIERAPAARRAISLGALSLMFGACAVLAWVSLGRL